jgi:hypothetical protein
MPQKPVDLAKIREAERELAEALERYPELREANEERGQALADWLPELDTEDHSNE